MSLPKLYQARFVSWNSTGSVVDFRVRFLGRERKLNGSLIISEDLDSQRYTVSAETYTDVSGSGDYKLSPFAMPHQSVCQAAKSFWVYFKHTLKYGVNTDIPFELEPCPIPKGNYYIKDATIETDGWPHIMPRGYFKGSATFKRDNQVIGTQEVVILIEDRTPF
ncbi:hypothetical protein KR084_007682 [Drosophila pseudotakahashii]|nr:hypothetical protein KR084_007682 [Drosophila pseudotakahashii]